MDRFFGADAAELTASLELAAQLSKQLSTTTDPSHLHQIHSSLTAAHNHLSSFLSLPNQTPKEDSNDASAINSNAEPMQVVDEEEDAVERNSRNEVMIDEVEEKMRENFFIRNKRQKRPISPSSAAEAEMRSLFEDENVSSVAEVRYDPKGTRLRNLQLIRQFHC